jgi:hypothetical protein
VVTGAHPPRDGFGIDRGEVPPVDEPLSFDRGLVADLRDDVGVGQPGDRLRVRPAHQRHAHHRRVACFGDQQHSRTT